MELLVNTNSDILSEVFIGIINMEGNRDGYIVKSMLVKHFGIPKENINVMNFLPASSTKDCGKIINLNHNHQKVSKKALELGYKYALVFEDDANINTDKLKCKDVFNEILKDLKAFKWDIIFLGSSPKTPMLYSRKWLCRTLFSTCAHAYFISEPAMIKLTEYKFPKQGEDDKCYGSGTFNVIDWKVFPYMKNYTTYPPIVHQKRCPGFLVKYLGECNHEKYQNINNHIAFYSTYVLILLLLYLIKKNKIFTKLKKNIM